MKLSTLAWRNIWRNRLRSSTVIASVLLGIAAGIFASALMKGMLEGRFDNFIEDEISHLQVHHPDFVKEPEVRHTLKGGDEVLTALGKTEGIQATTARIRVQGMIASANYTGGIVLTGILPEAEERVTGFSQKMHEGEYLETGDGNRILIGKSLAEKMKVGIGSRVVLTFQDADYEIVSAAFTVKGIFQTISNRYDEGLAFVPAAYLRTHLANDEPYHEVAVLLNDIGQSEPLKAKIQALYPEMRVRTWEEVAPELTFWLEAGDVVGYVFIVIILLGLAFGLLNTMLMAVFERTRELGMLMAVGMNKRRVFALIVWETLFLSLIGAAAGLGLGYAAVAFTAKNGIDLSQLSDVMRELGFSEFIYPSVDPFFLVLVPLMVVATALLAAVYPAIRALKLNPAEAVRE